MAIDDYDKRGSPRGRKSTYDSLHNLDDDQISELGRLQVMLLVGKQKRYSALELKAPQPCGYILHRELADLLANKAQLNDA